MIQHFENQKRLALLNGIKKALKYFELRPLDINFDRTNGCHAKLGDHIIALPHTNIAARGVEGIRPEAIHDTCRSLVVTAAAMNLHNPVRVKKTNRKAAEAHDSSPFARVWKHQRNLSQLNLVPFDVVVEKQMLALEFRFLSIRATFVRLSHEA